MDLASYLQGKWKSMGDDMRRQAGQTNAQNMREHLPTLLMGLNAIGSRVGAIRGNDYVTANQIQRLMRQPEMLNAPTYDMGVTGGSPMRFPHPIPDLPHPQAAAGLAQNPGVRPAGEAAAAYYPVRRDYPVAANEQTSLQGALASPQRGDILARIRAGVAEQHRRGFNVIPGGKAD